MLATAGLGQNGLRLLALLFKRLLVNVNLVKRDLEIAFPTANRLVARFEEEGLLAEITGQRRSRWFRYDPYLRLFNDPEPEQNQRAAVEITEASTSRPLG